MDQRIRINVSRTLGCDEEGRDINYIEGCFPKDDENPVELPTVGIATGSFLEEVESGMVKQFTEKTREWINQGTIKKE